MKRIKIRPQLVDHSLLTKPAVPVIAPPLRKPILETHDNSFLINIIGLVILCTVGYIMYDRYTKKDLMDTENRHRIIGLNHYVTKKLNEETTPSS